MTKWTNTAIGSKSKHILRNIVSSWELFTERSTVVCWSRDVFQLNHDEPGHSTYDRICSKEVNSIFLGNA